MKRPSSTEQEFIGGEWPVIDAHTHVFDPPITSRTGDERQLREIADRYDLEALVVMPLFGGTCPTRNDVRAGNLVVHELSRRDTRIRPMVTVYPRHGSSALDELDCWMDLGFCGLKIWLNPADEPCVFPLIERMIEYGKPTLIHAMHKTVGQYPLESDPRNVAALAARYPQARIIMPHVGGNFYYSTEVIAPHPNVLTDPSGTYCETGMLEHAVKLLGAERILFGSDAPGADFVNNVAKVLAANLTDDVRRLILAGNARKLWNWQ
jgi:uncharacterized protein